MHGHSYVCVYTCSQLVKNWRTGKGDEALSFWFLLQWFLGDATNLIGAILSHQLGTQVSVYDYYMHWPVSFNGIVHVYIVPCIVPIIVRSLCILLRQTSVGYAIVTSIASNSSSNLVVFRKLGG